MMCQQFFYFEMPLTAFDFDKNLLPLPGQLKPKFIFHWIDCEITTSFCDELYMIESNDEIFFFTDLKYIF